MDYAYLLQGYILGLSVASTIGVSGVLCLQNMMTGQLSIGLTSALAASLADMCCGVLVVFGLQAVQSLLVAYQFMFSMIAGLFLCVLGLRKLFAKVIITEEHAPSIHMLGAFGSVFFLSLVDPVSIADFMALCLGLTLDFSLVHKAIQFIGGLFLGSVTWWFSLCCFIMLLRQSLSVQILQHIQQVVGAGIFGLGFWTIFAAWRI